MLESAQVIHASLIVESVVRVGHSLGLQLPQEILVVPRLVVARVEEVRLWVVLRRLVNLR